MLYTILDIDIDSLASRLFPKAKNSVVCAEFPVSSKFFFSEWEKLFFQFITIDKHLKFNEIEYLIYYDKFEIWLALVYVNFLSYF